MARAIGVAGIRGKVERDAPFRGDVGSRRHGRRLDHYSKVGRVLGGHRGRDVVEVGSTGDGGGSGVSHQRPISGRARAWDGGREMG